MPDLGDQPIIDAPNDTDLLYGQRGDNIADPLKRYRASGFVTAAQHAADLGDIEAALEAIMELLE